jgi:AraC-like DNA-binding protein
MTCTQPVYCVSVALIGEVHRVARAWGYSMRPGQGCSAGLLRTSGYLPLHVLQSDLAGLRRQSGDPDIALRLGCHIAPSAFSLLSYLVMACERLDEALHVLTRYHPLILDCGHWELAIQGDDAIVRWRLPDPLQSHDRLLVDFGLSCVAHFGAWLTGVGRPYRALRVQYARPEQSAHADIFGIPARFNAGETSLVIPRAMLAAAIPTADSTVKPVLRQQAERLLNATRCQRASIGRVRQVLIEVIQREEPTLEMVAARLNVSPRSLQRNLQAEQTNFQTLLQEVRLMLAEELLRENRLSVFSSAYKNWTGRSPQQARAQRSEGNSGLVAVDEQGHGRAAGETERTL